MDTITPADVIVGLDTHKHIHAAVALNGLGARLGKTSIPVSPKGYRELEVWARAFGCVRAFGIAGTGSDSAGLSRARLAQGHTVVEVNRGGNRHANAALYRVVIVRLRRHLPPSDPRLSQPRGSPRDSRNARSSAASNGSSPARSTQISAAVFEASSQARLPLDGYRSINAPMESFFHTLKVELAHRRRWATRDEARRDLFASIQGYDNRQPIHSALGYFTPEQAGQNAT